MTEKDHFDAIVTGVFNNFKGTEASVKAKVSCKHDCPIGEIEGKVAFIADDTGVLQRYKFCSDDPVFVKTSKHLVRSVKANFKNVKLENLETCTEIRDCKACLVACQTGRNRWTGFLAIVTPSGRKITVFGTYSGNVRVLRTVCCKKKHHTL